MVKLGAKAAVPRLRFPEFVGKPFREVQLKDVTSESITRNVDGLSTKSVMGVTKAEGIVPMAERLIAPDIARYKVVQKDWFAYNPMRLNIGSIARWQGDSDVLVSPDYVVFQCSNGLGSEIAPAYLDYFRRSGAWEEFVTEGGDGSVRVRIYYKDLARLHVTLPSFAEQEKVADCLASLNEVIAVQGRKVEALTAYKRGLMQQLFPREGETSPHLRFPEFCGAPEWVQSSLGKLVDIQSGGTPSKAIPEFWNGTIPWVSAKDMKHLFLNDSEDHISQAAIDNGAKTVPVGTLLMLTRGMTLLKDVPICIVGRDMAFNQDVKALRTKGGVDVLFLAFLLLARRERLLAMVDIAGHGTGKLDTDELRAFDLATPGPEEQQRIADCLSSIDTQIISEIRQLTALKTHRRGLVQQLFPSGEGE